MDCIFCKIANQEISAHKVYEDDKVVAFLDKHPFQPGHTLVIPKKHESDFFNLEGGLFDHLMKVVKDLSKMMNDKMKPKKVGLAIAGWDIPHVHVHIVPMHDYHDITSKSLIEGKRSNPTNEELTEIAEKLKM